jgi:hypothetical protein
MPRGSKEKFPISDENEFLIEAFGRFRGEAGASEVADAIAKARTRAEEMVVKAQADAETYVNTQVFALLKGDAKFREKHIDKPVAEEAKRKAAKEQVAA